MTGELDNNDYRLGRLFDGYVFHVPDYQRFYSWSTQECEDLWDDLRNLTGDEHLHHHYMGTIILKDEGKPVETKGYRDDYREYAIVDGQQRFTSLVLLVKAIGSAFGKLGRDNDVARVDASNQVKEQVSETRSQFVQDPKIQDSSYQAQNKLQLQKEDARIFAQILRQEIDRHHISTPSQRRLVEAYDFYEAKLRDLHARRETADRFLDDIGRLLSAIDSLEFMVYVVDSQARATLIFESVNDRGKDLSRLDKTKSFLMHKHYLSQSKEEADVAGAEIQDRFGAIYRSMQTIEKQDRTSDIDEDQIQRYHYISQIPPDVNKTYLKEVANRRRGLQSGAPIYLSVLKWHFNRLYDQVQEEPHDQHPRDCLDEIDWYTRSLRRYYSRLAAIAEYGADEDLSWELSKLFALGRVGNFYPLLLTAWDEYEEGRVGSDELYELLQMIEVASFRIYAIGNKRADTGRSRFYRLANSLGRHEVDIHDIVLKLKEAVEKYESSFEKALKDNNAYDVFSYRDLRYLLYSYDLYISRESKGGAPSEIRKAVQNAGQDYSLDHVWAQNTDELSLTEEEQIAHNELKHSLGNLTLVTGPRNSSWKNDPYEAKRTDRRYKDSAFASTRKLAREYDRWGRSSIEHRLGNLVDYALKRWSLDSDRRQAYATIKPPE